MATNDIPAAFPRDNYCAAAKGMNLRDWFAGQIASGRESIPDERVYSKRPLEQQAMTVEEWRESLIKQEAAYFYRMADAMLAARDAS